MFRKQLQNGSLLSKSTITNIPILAQTQFLLPGKGSRNIVLIDNTFHFMEKRLHYGQIYDRC